MAFKNILEKWFGANAQLVETLFWVAFSLFVAAGLWMLILMTAAWFQQKHLDDSVKDENNILNFKRRKRKYFIMAILCFSAPVLIPSILAIVDANVKFDGLIPTSFYFNLINGNVIYGFN